MHNVLIVEDSATFRKAFKEALCKRLPHMNVAEAENGIYALQKIKEFSPDLVFMDIRLPNESGLELTEKIKSMHPEIIVVILTEYDLQEYRDAACFVGADEFISKGTLNLGEIVVMIERLNERVKGKR